MRRAWLLSVWLLQACGSPAPSAAPHPAPPTSPAAHAPSREPDVVPISIVGTNDLHGHLEMLPLLAGYVARLRTLREATGGAVVLLDGGDMFQGTLESNLAEGAPVVEAYEAIGYDAVTIGNHEFDYGPVGERATPREPGDDPRGALRARIAEADFAVLSANIHIRGSGAPMNIGELPSVVIERAGVRIGILGVTTEGTLATTLAGNVADLMIDPLTETIAREAARLRTVEHVALVLVTAHAGGNCERNTEPLDLSHCHRNEEIFEVAEALPAGAVDVIVAGHTHQYVSHVVNGIAIIESGSYGRSFGRVDIGFDRANGRIVSTQILPSRDLCDERPSEENPAACRRAPYEGHAVEADAHVASVLAPAVEAARGRREELLGVILTGRIEADREEECALGNLFTDLMLEGHPGADAAIINGGGLRADLPEGPLEYGALYQSMPFDNRYAVVRMRAEDLGALVAENAGRSGSYFSLGGLRAEVRCESEGRAVSFARLDGTAVAPDAMLTVLTSDFLATGGDGFFAALHEAHPEAFTIEDDPPIREAMASALRARGGRLDPRTLVDRRHPRIAYPGGHRPVRCE